MDRRTSRGSVASSDATPEATDGVDRSVPATTSVTALANALFMVPPTLGDYPTWKLLMKVDGVRTTQIWPWDFAPASFTLKDALPFLTGAPT